MHDNSSIVLAEARLAALTSAGYHDDSPPDPDATARDSIQAFAAMAPSVGVAAGLLSVAGVRPVPVDRETLEPTSAPLPDLAAVESHWRANYTDGVGVRAGVQANGSTVFAIRGTGAALRDWLAEVGTEADERVNEYGSIVHSSRTYRRVTRFTRIGWTSPPTPPGRSIVSFGAALVDGVRPMRSDHSDNERALGAVAWLAWTVAAAWAVPPDDRQRRLVVRSRRIDNGVEVVGDGDLIPWHVRRGNGWTCAAANLPIADDGEPLSPWLAEAVGATWKAVR
jgi:hypothetical protein